MKRLKVITPILILIFLVFGGIWYFEPFSGLTNVAGSEAYIETPNNSANGEELPVVMAIHGNGRSAASYNENSRESVDFYIHQKNLATSEGYLFVSISNGTDTWGTDEGLKNLDELYSYVQENYNVEEEWTLWSTSAGGLQMNRFIKDFPERVDKAIGTFPVYDLEDMLNHNDTAKSVWGDDDITDVNPVNFSESLVNVPFLIFHGEDDVVVPPEKHSQQFAETINELGGDVTLYIVDGGHSTENFNVYDDAIIREFLNK